MEPATFAWLLSQGIRLDDHRPDEREMVHLAALRQAKREAGDGSSRFTRLARRIGLAPIRSTAAPVTCACPA